MTPAVARDLLKAEQRRMALVAILSAVGVLALVGLGAADALGFIAPTLGLLTLLVLGRYPGAEPLERLLAREPRPRAGRSRSSASRHQLAWPLALRLLEGSLASRGPPVPCLA